MVRDRYIDQCSHAGAALYLFLACVGDDKGLSYYADKSIMKILSMDRQTLCSARENLIRIGLIAWKQPIYQVLSLDALERISTGQTMSLGDILKNAMKEAS